MHYLFKHVLTREVVYVMQMGGRLRHMHRQAAEAIQSVYAESASDYPAAIAAAQSAIRLAQDTNSQAQARLTWGRALWRQGDYNAAHAQFEQLPGQK